MKRLLTVILVLAFIQNAAAVDEDWINQADLTADQITQITNVTAMASAYQSVVKEIAAKQTAITNLTREIGKAKTYLDVAKTTAGQAKSTLSSAASWLTRNRTATLVGNATNLVNQGPGRVTILNEELAQLQIRATQLRSALPPGRVAQLASSARQVTGQFFSARASDVKKAVGGGVPQSAKAAFTQARMSTSSTFTTVRNAAGVAITSTKHAVSGAAGFTWRTIMVGISGGTYVVTQAVWQPIRGAYYGGKFAVSGAGKLAGAGLKYGGPAIKTVYGNPYVLTGVIAYNAGKLAIYSSTAKWISSPPDVVLSGFQINPETKQADITYYLSVNADKNIRTWDTASKVFEDTSELPWYQTGLQAFTEVLSLNATDLITTNTEEGLEDGFTLRDIYDETIASAVSDLSEAKSLPANDLLLSCRVVIYKITSEKENNFRARDEKFEPITVFFPPENCKEGEGQTYSFSLADQVLPSGNYEAILFAYFHPAVIIASRNIIDGTYDREGWFISNSWWPWKKGVRTFAEYEEIWKHGFVDERVGLYTIPLEIKPAMDEALRKAGGDPDSLVEKMTQFGMPSNPVYFSPMKGDAYVDLSKAIEENDYKVHDKSKGETRPIDATDIRTGLIRVLKIGSDSSVEEFSLYNIVGFPYYKNYLGFQSISPGDYVLETQIYGYTEPIKMRFTIATENFLGAKTE